MVRFVLAVFAIFSGAGLVISFLSSIASRNDGLTQAILGLALGMTSLIFVASLGLFSVIGLLQASNDRVATALKDIALSNSEGARAAQAIHSKIDCMAASAPKFAPEPAPAFGSHPALKGRLQIEAEMLEKLDAQNRSKPA